MAYEGNVRVENAQLYVRDVGQGRPIVVMHGGPDFDHSYLLPDLDRLADEFRLIYYDQRGRGRSSENVQPDEVTLQSEIEDLESVRGYFGFDTVAVLGHSWGGLLAMEYAIRYPKRVSQLMLLNTGPASHADYLLFQEKLSQMRTTGDVEQMKELASGPGYEAGDVEMDAAYYRIHFRPTLRDPAQLERLVQSLRRNFRAEGIRKARAIEQRLYAETWTLPEYDRFPWLKRLRVPTLVLHGDYDFIPVEVAAHVAQAIPGSHFVVLGDCGHFSYMESPDQVQEAIEGLFNGHRL